VTLFPYTTLFRSDDLSAVKSIALDRSQAQVFVDKVPVALTAMEYKLLATLIAARGHVLYRQQLLSAVYGKQPPPSECSIDSQVEGLRRKMGPAGGYIQAVSDAGYAFCGPTSERPPA
jgi:DNA-binding response OmpR family regulator